MDNKNHLSNFGNIYLYLVSFLALVASIISKNLHGLLLIPILFFTLYDAWFTYGKNYKSNFEGRGYKGTVDSIRSASTYVSYFIALIGVTLGFMLSSENGNKLLDTITNNCWTKAYGLLTIILSGLVLLFIPIFYKDDDGSDIPSLPLRHCFFIALLSEKMIILLLSYLILLVTKGEV